MSLEWSENPKSRIEIDGRSLEYACFGPRPNEEMTILLLHHGLGSLTSWNDFPRELSESTGLGVFAYSRFGYGMSDHTEIPLPLDFMTREAMDTLPEIFDKIGLERGILAGHSDGASIAAIYSGSSADHRIRGVVLIAPHFFVEETTLDSIKKLKTDFDSGDLKTKLQNCHSDADRTFHGWYDCWMNPKFKSWNVGEVIDYIRVPVLAIQGRQDQFGTLKQIEEIEKRIYSPLEMEIFEDCKHMPHVEKTRQTLEAISEFTKRLERIDSEKVEIS